MSADLIGDDVCREAFNKARQQRFSVHGLDVVCEPDIFRAGYAAGRDSEIAKRDETIARLEPQLNRAIQANYDLREELAACRVAVENCELFRARIAELEEKLAVDDDANFNLRGLLKRGAFALGLDPENTSWLEVIGELEKQSAELAAIKAQEPVAYISGCYRDVIDGKSDCTPLGAELAFVNIGWIGQIPLYAAPVSEAKAQGVVFDGSQLAGLLEQVRLDDDEAKPHGSGATYWNNAVIACQVAIRDALAAHRAQGVPSAKS